MLSAPKFNSLKHNKMTDKRTTLSHEDFVTIVDLIETFYIQGVDDASNGGAYDEIRREILNQVYMKFDHPPVPTDDDLPF